VQCTLRIDGPDILAQVQDSGPGLPAGECVETLFQPFHRGLNARSKGLGLGLSITRRICHALGGEIHAESPEHGGLRFTARFPALP